MTTTTRNTESFDKPTITDWEPIPGTHLRMAPPVSPLESGYVDGKPELPAVSWNERERQALDAMRTACNNPSPAPDMINHPPHYNRGGIECIDVIEAWRLGYHLGNAVKYICRAGEKGDALTDMRKAVWYIEREIKLMEANCE